jgi:hypothetical protein
MNRSTIVLNIHNDVYPNFENRVIQALFCRRPVLSERLSGDLLTPERDYSLVSSPDDLLHKVIELRETKNWPRPEVDLLSFTVERLLERLGINAT